MEEPVLLRPSGNKDNDVQAIFDFLFVSAFDVEYDPVDKIGDKLKNDIIGTGDTKAAWTLYNVKRALPDEHAVGAANLHIRFEIWRRDTYDVDKIPYKYQPLALIKLISPGGFSTEFTGLDETSIMKLKQDYMVRVFNELENLGLMQILTRMTGYATSEKVTFADVVAVEWPAVTVGMRSLRVGGDVRITNDEFDKARKFLDNLLGWMTKMGTTVFELSPPSPVTTGPSTAPSKPIPSTREEPSTASSSTVAKPPVQPSPALTPPYSVPPTTKPVAPTGKLVDSLVKQIDELKVDRETMRAALNAALDREHKLVNQLKKTTETATLRNELILTLQKERAEFADQLRTTKDEKEAVARELDEEKEKVQDLTVNQAAARLRITEREAKIAEIQGKLDRLRDGRETVSDQLKAENADAMTQLARLNKTKVLKIIDLGAKINTNVLTEFGDLSETDQSDVRIIIAEDMPTLEAVIRNYNTIRATSVFYIARNRTGRWEFNDSLNSFQTTFGQNIPKRFFIEAEVESLMQAANAGGGGAGGSIFMSAPHLAKQDQFRRLASGQYGTNRVQATFMDAQSRVSSVIDLSRLDARQTPDSQRYLVADLNDPETAVRYQFNGARIPRQGSVKLSAYDRGVLTKEVTMQYAVSEGATQTLTGHDSLRLYSTSVSADAARLDMLVLSY